MTALLLAVTIGSSAAVLLAALIGGLVASARATRENHEWADTSRHGTGDRP